MYIWWCDFSAEKDCMVVQCTGPLPSILGGISPILYDPLHPRPRYGLLQRTQINTLIYPALLYICTYVHYTLRTTVHTTHYTLHTAQYTTLYTLHTTQYTTLYTLHTTHYTIHYTLHTTHYTLHNTLQLWRDGCICSTYEMSIIHFVWGLYIQWRTVQY